MNKEFKLVDLTHSLSARIPSWDNSCGFELSIDTDYKDCVSPNLFRTQKINMSISVGTHMDAPAHCIPGGKTVDQLTLEELVTDCVVIDVSSKVNENYTIMPLVIEKFEKKYGKIKSGNFVIFYTSWDKYWSDRKKYHNNYKFPSVDISTAKILLERNITGIGIDTFSVDTGTNGFPVHHAILGANKYLVENVANAKKLPPTGAKIFILPMKIKNGTEAPVRIIAAV